MKNTILLCFITSLVVFFAEIIYFNFFIYIIEEDLYFSIYELRPLFQTVFVLSLSIFFIKLYLKQK